MTEQSFDFDEFQRQIIAEFRANGGRVGGMFEGSTLALLTTVGARTGLRRTSPLAYLEIDGQSLVVASAMGASAHPAWYHNIRHIPAVTVETGAETYDAVTGIPVGEERDALIRKVVERAPGFGEYQTRTTRVIPVVTLHRITPTPGAHRAQSSVERWNTPHGREQGRVPDARITVPRTRSPTRSGRSSRPSTRWARHPTAADRTDQCSWTRMPRMFFPSSRSR
jgi:deazaflavin-dependent oxidoreductase (nitroreductase family)